MNIRRRTDNSPGDPKKRRWPIMLVPVCLGVFALSVMLPVVGMALCAASEVGALVFKINKRD
jgi:hypothetical protein